MLWSYWSPANLLKFSPDSDVQDVTIGGDVHHFNFCNREKRIRRMRTVRSVLEDPNMKEKNDKMAKVARILALIVGVIAIVLALVKFFPLSNEGLVLAVFLTCWGLDALI